jgi:hypothetical protein
MTDPIPCAPSLRYAPETAVCGRDCGARRRCGHSGQGVTGCRTGAQRAADAQPVGFSQTETCLRLSLVKGSPAHPSQRPRKRSPAIRAIRSSSAGQA